MALKLARRCINCTVMCTIIKKGPLAEMCVSLNSFNCVQKASSTTWQLGQGTGKQTSFFYNPNIAAVCQFMVQGYISC